MDCCIYANGLYTTIPVEEHNYLHWKELCCLVGYGTEKEWNSTMTQGKHFAAGGDHFAALPNKKIHTPKGIARLTVTAATMAAMTGSSLISPFAACRPDR